MILKDSLLLTVAGVMSGVPLAMLMGRALTTSLYGVKPLDGLSYILATVGLAGVAVVDPVTALRTE